MGGVHQHALATGVLFFFLQAPNNGKNILKKKKKNIGSHRRDTKRVQREADKSEGPNRFSTDWAEPNDFQALAHVDAI